MNIFKKKPKYILKELKCTAEGCPFVCNDFITLKRHVDWKY